MFRVSLLPQAAAFVIAGALLAAPAVAQLSSAPNDAPRSPAAAERRARPALERETSDRPTADAPREAEEQQTDERQGLDKRQGADAPQGVEEQRRVDRRQATDARESLARALRDWSNEEPRVDESVQRSEIAAYYKKRNYAPIWRAADGFTESARSALGALRDAGRDGLRVNAPAQESSWSAAGELALSEAVADYAAQASGARVNPATISPDIEERPSVVKPAQALDAVAEAGDGAGARLAAFNPSHPAYAALREKLAELRAARGHPRRQAAAAHESDAKPITNFASLSEAKAKRVEAEIIANMERWRWEPREMGATRLEVNIPQFETTFTRDNQAVLRARVIVGKKTSPTPVFSDLMPYIIINPSWNVPESIIENELEPKTGGKLSKLRARGYKVTYRNGRPIVQQEPGEKNALGRLKFVFPNDLLIYMHDTPQKKLFARAKRAYSHGCVRVQDPFKLAEEVVARPGYDEKRLKALIGTKEHRINLAKPIPVHIEYFTAVVNDDGALKLYDDIYGYSAKVRSALAL
ncbi:L,D-transpeptidase family protein [Methylocystis hirsuta]|uniref:L,D-transpeptidase n=1 Tax=Methylocystis hirsuta TaxID=369798 RepID=A0A3M9XT41_9HYPH|nr:L,D-transpeptidase family protein [Methylocystis hirsuta]RNJ50030.1 L,D-transpeptidase [Methylocystis hirsuta]